MIDFHTCRSDGGSRPVADLSGPLPADAVWIDAKDPSPDEAAFIRRTAGVTLPSYEQLSEVENSSRLRRDDDAFYLSAPLVYRDGGLPRIAPVGFILTAERLVTVRYADLKAFDAFRARLAEHAPADRTSLNILVGLLEAVVDRLADILEETGTDLDRVADLVFHDLPDQEGKGAQRASSELRGLIKRVGRDRQLISKVRATLLGLDRIASYVAGEGESWLPDAAKARLATLRRDLDSLDEYEARLSDKIQFLLDASLGLINIEQNDTFRILTIVSVVGIPPTLVASMYGMNFKNMPELGWTYGYEWGLGLILLSAVLPVLYFRRRGWL